MTTLSKAISKTTGAAIIEFIGAQTTAYGKLTAVLDLLIADGHTDLLKYRAPDKDGDRTFYDSLVAYVVRGYPAKAQSLLAMPAKELTEAQKAEKRAYGMNKGRDIGNIRLVTMRGPAVDWRNRPRPQSPMIQFQGEPTEEDMSVNMSDTGGIEDLKNLQSMLAFRKIVSDPNDRPAALWNPQATNFCRLANGRFSSNKCSWVFVSATREKEVHSEEVAFNIQPAFETLSDMTDAGRIPTLHAEEEEWELKPVFYTDSDGQTDPGEVTQSDEEEPKRV